MKRRKGDWLPLFCGRMLPLILLLAAGVVAVPAYAQTCRPPQTALVLSGGGAKGLAHIGVLRVLDSLGIRPDLVVGSSMGAIIGGMYASGYSGREIDSLARTLPIADLFRTYQPRAPRSLGQLQPLVVWEQGDRRFNLQSASVAETEVNALVNAAMLRGNLLARGNFDSLPIPFRAVATDLADRSAVVLRSGDLARAVRASFAIPLIFAPESLNGRILADGGLVANIPIAVARAAGAERMIVSDATERMADSLDLYSPIVLADRLLGFLFEQPADSLRRGDVLIRPAVEGFTGLNFSATNVDALIRRGVAAADTVLPRAPCLPHGPPPLLRALPLRISSYEVVSPSASERLSLQRLLGLGLSDSLEPGLLRSRVRHLAQSEAYQAVWLSPRGAGDSVSFHVSARRSARRVAGLGLAYDNELGGRMWVGAVDRRTLNLALEGSAALFIGEFRKELYAGLRRNYQLGRQLMNPALTARLATESIRQFDSDGDELAPLKTREAVGFAGVERGFTAGWQMAVGAVGHSWHEPGRNRATLGGSVLVTKEDHSAQRRVQASLLWNGLYRRAQFNGEAYARIGPVRLRPRLRLGWGEQLPIQATFPLGGEDGFPGLHIGERRGDREVFLDLLLTYPLKGPFVGRLEVAGGRSAAGGALLDRDGWVGGGRIGLGAETPVGPVRFEYGIADGGRGAFFVRLGRWF
jgi:predicted acylesterase/phospholipase RssA